MISWPLNTTETSLCRRIRDRLLEKNLEKDLVNAYRVQDIALYPPSFVLGYEIYPKPNFEMTNERTFDSIGLLECGNGKFQRSHW